MKSKIRKKIGIGLLLIVLMQIFLLMNMAAADSYSIHQTDSIINEALETNKENKKILNFGLNLLTGILTIKQIGFVSAVGESGVLYDSYNTTNYAAATNTINDSAVSWTCCLRLKNGALCQDLAPAYASDCAVTPIPTKCSQVGECKPGCCFDSAEGLCTTNSPREKCEYDGGDWKDNVACLTTECQKGCCVLGENVNFVTEKRCERLSSLMGFGKDFRDYSTEIDCLALKEIQEFGACVVNGRCSLKTELECSRSNGIFYKDKLCSNSETNSNCTKQKSIGCYEEKDEIYWFDSCGNRENIYSSDKNASWNNGMLLEKNESCNPNSANNNSENCGNCNYFLGSKCSETKLTEKNVKDGNFVCKNRDCAASEATGNKFRKNGESWCAYDSFIGDGKDPAGSRHWKRMCIDG